MPPLCYHRAGRRERCRGHVGSAAPTAPPAALQASWARLAAGNPEPCTLAENMLISNVLTRAAGQTLCFNVPDPCINHSSTPAVATTQRHSGSLAMLADWAPYTGRSGKALSALQAMHPKHCGQAAEQHTKNTRPATELTAT